METNNIKKFCYICEKYKPLNEFHKNRKGYHGRSGKCKSCKKIYGVEYRKKVKIHTEKYGKGNGVDGRCKFCTRRILTDTNKGNYCSARCCLYDAAAIESIVRRAYNAL